MLEVVVVSCFFYKQKTAYEMRISDWSSDVCSSDLAAARSRPSCLNSLWRASAARSVSAARSKRATLAPASRMAPTMAPLRTLMEVEIFMNHPLSDVKEIGRASCRERVCQYV